MRVLFVNRWAGVYGGVEVYVRRMAIALAARGMHCALGFIEERGEGTGEYLSAFPEWFKAPDEASLAHEARRRNFDTVFLHKIDRAGSFLGLAPSVRVLRYIHDHDTVCPRRHKYYAFNPDICDKPAGLCCFMDAGFIERRGRSIGFKSPLRFFAELADNRRLPRILVGSAWMRKELLDNGFDPSRVFILPPVPPEHPAERGLPPGQPPVPRKAPLSDPDDPKTRIRYILYVGQLIRGKGVDLLIRAFALLAPEYSGLRLSIAGSGNAGERLRELSRELGLEDRIRFEGTVTSDRINALYAGAECLVVPSRWPEPFGMIGLEAMRKSIPIVGFAAGGIPDWLHDGINGFLVPRADIPALAAAIRKLLDDGSLAHGMGVAGRKIAETEFSFESTVDELVSHLTPGALTPAVSACGYQDKPSGGTR